MDDLSRTMAELPTAQNRKHKPHNWKSALLAVMVLSGLIAILWFVFREHLVPAAPVETKNVILLEQEQDGPGAAYGAEELLFQASGWVEPDPWSVKLAVKENGFVEEVLVKEGERVTNGQVVARLDPADAELALATAKATVRRHEAAVVALQHALLASNRHAEAAQYKIEAATARLDAKRDVIERYFKTSPDAVSPVERISQKQAVNELEAEVQIAQAQLDAHKAQCIRAEADIKEAEAALAAARKKQESAQLALDRMVIRSNTNGIILRRYAEPGDKRMMGADDPNSAVIASVYDPGHLQVRVDVPISEVGRVVKDQPTRIFSALLPGQTLTGSVTRIVGQADLQRNTLQVKVKIDEPPPRLRPDVLCRVEFRNAASSRQTGAAASGSHTLWVPVSALTSDTMEQAVWVVDPLTQTANRRSIKLAGGRRDGFRQIINGLRANERVVTKGMEALKEGMRVKEAGQ